MHYQLYPLRSWRDNNKSGTAQKENARTPLPEPGRCMFVQMLYRRLFNLDSSRSISRYNHTSVTMMPKAEYHSMYLGAP